MKKRLPKILTLFFLFVFALQLVGLIYLALTPEFGFAAEKQQIKFEPQVAIPGVEKINFSSENASTKPIGDYIKAIYEYGIAIVGILATVVMMIGGVMWIAAGGNASRISEAKAWIGASLTGLVLALSSYMILYTANPDLVNFKVSSIENVKEVIVGRCIEPSLSESDFAGASCIDGISEKNCTENYPRNLWTANALCPSVCCAWDLNNTASLSYSTTHAISVPLYENCIDYDKNLTESDCNAKEGLSQYLKGARCERTLLDGYRCVTIE